MGDGNVHFNVSQPRGADAEEFRGKAAEIGTLIYDIVSDFGGSISAEHGIGQAKREILRRYKDEVEIAVMKSIKAALDPGNILNPGKVL
jgi:FAD/FMN-containing dehydrogenase